jgi:adenylate kinase
MAGIREEHKEELDQ